MKKLLIASLALGATACTTTATKVAAPVANQPVEVIQAAQPLLKGEQLTMKQIMADPTWMGIAPTNAQWRDDNSIFYSLKQADSPLYDVFVQAIDGKAKKLGLGDAHLSAQANGVLNSDKSLKAFTYQGNIFIKELSSGTIKQLTRDSSRRSQLQFLTDGRLAYKQDNAFYAIDLASNSNALLVEIKFAKAPKAPQTPTTYIGAQQHRLIKYVALEQHNKAVRFKHKQDLKAQNKTMATAPFYLDPKHRLVEMSLSPSGDKLLVATKDKSVSWRSKHDIMPNYLGSQGYVEAVDARARVAEAKPNAHTLVYIDVATRKQQTLDFSQLPGFDDDVLASVKAENYAKQGKKYVSKKAPRNITLLPDWTWRQSAMAWNDDGSALAIMLEANDNKDRWLTSYDFANNKLKTLHRLHDDAWVNYTFNEFGWLNDNASLYFLSEESGYSQVYTVDLKGKIDRVTSGKYEISSVTLSDDGKTIFYKANKSHPGKYEIYRTDLATKQQTQLTKLGGMTDYKLSPAEDKLLLTHSSLLRHNDIYVASATKQGEVKRLTDTVSEEFASYDWQAPKIVAVPSSHGEQPIYAKIYLPPGFDSKKAESYPAVIFNHGAGYLQNSHYGFSGYFREFMFHNLLAQQGYVVMDMDYRASKGYGRDWRTAIYRQMGTPEIQDLEDGVDYMSKYLQVDKNRVGTYGGSYGGFMTFMALFTKPELFQAGAALRPVTDWAHYNDGYTSNILNRPNDDDIAYRKSSPIEYAQNLNKPLLIMAGVLDDNVFFQDSVRLVQRLIELEKEDFETAIYPVEPHGFRQPSSWLDEYRRIFKLFEENLKK
ncbi:prolyl oligopeptidase family serine peptidase [Psychrobium sp. MM17-31]|uniref:S9 family peptidase n=1 Tax=Psychrobium sp. MM17-31 TaxID=2917758 RepID=UPI001EF3EBF7|nr:prolyl oligopeptidase family serine peptidase [Psychrobium sp. MM17-31]MCG7532536.1 prolyl oligopeptidase family serine peptidase [Psychrobium sp. MM17-31]